VRGICLKLLLGCALFTYQGIVYGQDAQVIRPPTNITFDFERDGLMPPVWGFEIYSSGKDRYYERDSKTDISPSSNRWSDVSVSATTMAVLLAAESTMSEHCETKAKNIANTGKKTLVFWHSDFPRSCIFNYSDDAAVMAAASAFQSMAETIQIGEKLKHSLRYDRLGLDAEMDVLVEEVKSGNAIEVQNIAPVLQSIIDDDRVMERVKRKAGHLLEGAGIAVKP